MGSATRIVIGPLLLLAIATGQARAVADAPIAHPFQVTGDPLFAPVDATLDALVAHKATSEANHLCVIGQKLDDGSRQAWVHWRERNSLILWEPSAGGPADLALSRRYLRLDRDAVAADDKRLASSSYLVPRDWAKAVIAECAAQGTQFVIGKRQAAASLQPGGKSP